MDAAPESIKDLRGRIAELIAATAADAGRVDDVRLAITEAVTNVVLHAYVDDPVPGTVRVRAIVDDVGQQIVVSDEGRGMVSRSDSPGMGIGMRLMEELSDEFVVRSDTTGSEVAMRFRL